MADWTQLRLQKGLTLNEVIEILNASSDEDNEAHQTLKQQREVDVSVLPPVNACEAVTDEDSGDEERPTIDNLPGKQLNALAEIECVKYADSCAPKKKKKYHWLDGDIQVDKTVWPVLFGPKNSLNPEELFSLFIDEDILSLIVSYSNQYAAKKNLLGDISENEMKIFIAILLLSGYVDLPRKNMLWENSPDNHNILVSKVISRDRFKFIMSNLHVCNNDYLDKNDRFAKVRPLLFELNKRLVAHVPHYENHSLDEPMVPYFGKHGCKQFLRGKPVRFGFKLWTGATSNGYIAWMDPYQGANSSVPLEYQVLGLGASVVLQYANILNQHQKLPYHIFFDNFFNSVPLLEELGKMNIRGTGTIRENRTAGCPLSDVKSFKKSSRGSSEVKRATESNIAITRWNDNNVVSVASNCIPSQPFHNTTRYSQKEKKRVTVKQPHNIFVYNKHMGGVDRADQNISLYRTSIRGKKWYFCLLTHCFDVAEQSAWLLHRLQGGTMDHLAFRRRLVISILEKNAKTCKSKGRPSKTEHQDSRFDGMEHWVVQQEKQTRCRKCHSKTTRCMKCDVGLHVKCFQTYHTL